MQKSIAGKLPARALQTIQPKDRLRTARILEVERFAVCAPVYGRRMGSPASFVPWAGWQLVEQPGPALPEFGKAKPSGSAISRGRTARSARYRGPDHVLSRTSRWNCRGPTAVSHDIPSKCRSKNSIPAEAIGNKVSRAKRASPVIVEIVQHHHAKLEYRREIVSGVVGSCSGPIKGSHPRKASFLEMAPLVMIVFFTSASLSGSMCRTSRRGAASCRSRLPVAAAIHRAGVLNQYWPPQARNPRSSGRTCYAIATRIIDDEQRTVEFYRVSAPASTGRDIPLQDIALGGFFRSTVPMINPASAPETHPTRRDARAGLFQRKAVEEVHCLRRPVCQPAALPEGWVRDRWRSGCGPRFRWIAGSSDPCGQPLAFNSGAEDATGQVGIGAVAL